MNKLIAKALTISSISNIKECPIRIDDIEQVKDEWLTPSIFRLLIINSDIYFYQSIKMKLIIFILPQLCEERVVIKCLFTDESFLNKIEIPVHKINIFIYRLNDNIFIFKNNISLKKTDYVSLSNIDSLKIFNNRNFFTIEDISIEIPIDFFILRKDRYIDNELEKIKQFQIWAESINFIRSI